MSKTLVKDLHKAYNVKRIQKECFWDYNFTYDEIIDMAKGNNEYKRKFLFQKIFANSTAPAWDLQIFNRDYVVKKLKEYKAPRFNNKYFTQRHEALSYIFGVTDKVPERLRWKK